MTLKNRVAVITGASGGLGRVVTRQFAEYGVQLALLGRNLKSLTQLAGELRLPEQSYLAHASDLSEPHAARVAGDAILAKFGRIDILLHLVGGWVGGQTVIDIPLDDVSNMLQQHFWTSFYLAQAFVPILVSNHWGRFIVVSSPLASRPQAKTASYAIGKAAQETLMMTLAQELKGTGVTTNVILVRTIDVKHERDREPASPKATWTTPEEITSAILYLCSDEAHMVNGARIPLFGNPWP